VDWHQDAQIVLDARSAPVAFAGRRRTRAHPLFSVSSLYTMAVTDNRRRWWVGIRGRDPSM